MEDLEELKKRINESGEEGIDVQTISSDNLVILKKSGEYEVRQYPQMRYDPLYHIYRI